MPVASVFAVPRKRTSTERDLVFAKIQNYFQAKLELDKDMLEFCRRVGNKRFSELTTEEQHEYESLRLREGMLGQD